MRFDCNGLARRAKREQWHHWFAWHPVTVQGGHCHWLELVERKIEYCAGFDGVYTFPQYRELKG